MKTTKIMLIAGIISVSFAIGCSKSSDDSSSSSANTLGSSGGTVSSGQNLSGTYTGDVTIPADTSVSFTGLVIIKSPAKLTIGAGATLKGVPAQSPPSSVIIDKGAQIFANGTAAKPIVFTSGNNVGSRAAQDWGGIVIRGNAQTNHTTQPFTTEFDDAGTYGSGSTANNAENSGTMTYVRSEFGAKQATSTKEYNGFSFEGVGSGTTIDYLHSHMNADDGIEFFGGTVNVKHIIVTGTGDDGFDWTFGWTGKAQFVIVAMTNGDASADSNGMEADNSEFGDNLTPYSNPTLYNFTLVSDGRQWRQIMRFRRGTKGILKNFYVANWCDTILVENTSTPSDGNTANDNITTTNVANGELKITNSRFEAIMPSTTAAAGTTCATAATSSLTGTLNATGSYDAIVNDGTNTIATTVGAYFTASNWTNTPSSTAFFPGSTVTGTSVAPPNDGFFDNTANFIGAVNTTTNWTTWTAYAAN